MATTIGDFVVVALDFQNINDLHYVKRASVGEGSNPINSLHRGVYPKANEEYCILSSISTKFINLHPISAKFIHFPPSSSSLTKGPMPVGARCRSRYSTPFLFLQSSVVEFLY